MKILALLTFSIGSIAMAANADIPMVTAVEAAKRVEAGTAVLVDVREPAEWAETGVAQPAALLPMSDLLGDKKLWQPFLNQNAGKEVLLYCRSGNRSGKVAEKLAKAGFTVANAGAFKDWAAAGLPVRKP